MIIQSHTLPLPKLDCFSKISPDPCARVGRGEILTLSDSALSSAFFLKVLERFLLSGPLKILGFSGQLCKLVHVLTIVGQK